MPQKDRTFTHYDLARLACHNLTPEEQVKIVHDLIEKECFSIEFTTDPVEKIICQRMEVSARRRLMKRLITESGCNGENKTISCRTIGALKTAIEALTMLMGILSFLVALLPLLRTLTWLVRVVVWLERLFDRIGVVEKYLKATALTMQDLWEYSLKNYKDLLAREKKLGEEPPATIGIDTSALNDDFPKLIAELSVIAKDEGAEA